MTPLVDLYEAKEDGYFTAARHDLLALLPIGRRLRILEIGAGRGATLAAAKRAGLASFAVGVDVVRPGTLPESVDRFLVCDVESTPLEFAQGEFDVVICGDVLEHLVDPWSAVRSLAALLSPGGCLVASLPNVRNHRLLRKVVLSGDFGYEEAGLLDRGHLRFFCRKNAVALFEGAGLKVAEVRENMGGYGRVNRLVDTLTLSRLHDFFVFQFLLRAEKV